MTETLPYCSPFSAYFSIVLTQDSLFAIIRQPIVAAGYCSRDSIVLVTSIVRVTLLFSVSI